MSRERAVFLSHVLPLGLAGLCFALACTSAPERLARSLTLDAWTYDSESGGSAHRVAANGQVGSGGVVDSSGEGYGFGVSMSLDKLLGPEPQPIRILGPVPAAWEAPAEVWPAWEAPKAPEKPQDQRSPEPRGKPARPWWMRSDVQAGAVGLLLGLGEVVSRMRGGGGLVKPAARMARKCLPGARKRKR